MLDDEAVAVAEHGADGLAGFFDEGAEVWLGLDGADRVDQEDSLDGGYVATGGLERVLGTRNDVVGSHHAG